MDSSQQPLMDDYDESARPPAPFQGRAHRLSTASRTSSVHVFDEGHGGLGSMQDDFNLKTTAVKWWDGCKADFQSKKEAYRPRDWFGHVLPCLSWLIGYKVRPAKQHYPCTRNLSAQTRNLITCHLTAGLQKK
jgi:hypothetical protein